MEREARRVAAIVDSLEVRISPTPRAFDLFNRYPWQDRKVVLLAHSTC